MNLSSLLQVFLVFVREMPLSISQQIRYEMYQKMSNATCGIPSSVITSIAVSSSFVCSRACVKITDCLGFVLPSLENSVSKNSLAIKTFQCQLLHSNMFQKSSKWTFFGVRRNYPVESYSVTLAARQTSTPVVINQENTFKVDCRDKDTTSSLGIVVAIHESTVNDLSDVDYVKCLHLENGLGLDTSDVVHIGLSVATGGILSDGVSQCPDNYVITAFSDTNIYFANVDYATCVRLMNYWSVDYSDCWVKKRGSGNYIGQTDPNMPWNFECPRAGSEPRVLVGFLLNNGMIMKCCKLISLNL
ncbi:uncharacterized protein LOC143257374 [Tachypleus tridentatus]|uniref:uncharacterized protein LOC143257374 n=1 Tax=Tachypleus tridentatus TaxID=6853 RepID=UPI003FD4981A